MSLYLSYEKKLNILKKQIYIENKSQLINDLNNIYKNTINYCKNLLKYENLINYVDDCVNPIKWQLGHIILFYIDNTLKLLEKKDNFRYNLLKIYIRHFEKYNKIKLTIFDSEKCNKLSRFKYNNIKFKQLKLIYFSIIQLLLSYINKNTIDSINTYLIRLSILHNDMHNENFIFTMYYLHIKNNFYYNNNNIKINNDFIKIKGGFFSQGININKNNLIFDNEAPSFNTYINTFSVSKYPITEYEYLDFVENNGYYNDELWCNESLEWKNKNNIVCPIYWFKNNNVWYKQHWDKSILVGSNIPIVNISWYEAQAYCKWRKVRLITETEWEYLSTNKGTTLYPWGNENINTTYSNINNINNFCTDVNFYEKGNNKDNISQLIGNCWEWCLETIYPYDNFVIDPIYREMSYPYFGKKKICRGGCFCVSDYLINSKYRNAQYPSCRIQFIGFRICKL